MEKRIQSNSINLLCQAKSECSVTLRLFIVSTSILITNSRFVGDRFSFVFAMGNIKFKIAQKGNQFDLEITQKHSLKACIIRSDVGQRKRIDSVIDRENIQSSLEQTDTGRASHRMNFSYIPPQHNTEMGQASKRKPVSERRDSDEFFNGETVTFVELT